VYSDAPDQLWACRDWLAFCASSSGQRTLTLPQEAKLREVFTNTAHETDTAGRVTLDAVQDTVYLFRVTTR